MAKDCVICTQKTLSLLFSAEQINAEELSKAQEKLRWKIIASRHKRRLVCGLTCYNEMMDLYDEYKTSWQRAPKKCLRTTCRHTERMHSSIDRSCTAAKCKCLGFLDKEDTEFQATDDEKRAKVINEFNLKRDEVIANGGGKDELTKLLIDLQYKHGLLEKGEE
jgi:hypothetical protein